MVHQLRWNATNVYWTFLSKHAHILIRIPQRADPENRVNSLHHPLIGLVCPLPDNRIHRQTAQAGCHGDGDSIAVLAASRSSGEGRVGSETIA